MSLFIKELIKNKLNRLTLQELLHYSSEYGFSITPAEGKQILMYIQNNKIDPFNKQQRERLFQDLAKITDQSTAIKAKNLFNEIINSYGLDNLFN